MSEKIDKNILNKSRIVVSGDGKFSYYGAHIPSAFTKAPSVAHTYNYETKEMKKSRNDLPFHIKLLYHGEPSNIAWN